MVIECAVILCFLEEVACGMTWEGVVGTRPRCLPGMKRLTARLVCPDELRIKF